MKHFLLIYDVKAGELKSQREFENAGEATAAYEAAELEHLLDSYMQIVLVASDSLDTIKVTHGNFFERTDFNEVMRSIIAG